VTLFLLLLLFGDDLSDQLPKIKRVFVDRLTGGETAAQMRDLIIAALENSKRPSLPKIRSGPTRSFAARPRI